MQATHLSRLSLRFAVPTIGVAVLASASAAQAAVIASAVNPANGHTYELLASATWAQSQVEAVTLGGNLATVRSQAENDWLFNTFAFYGGVGRGLWIGLNDVASEGNFVWTSGEITSYRNWSVGQPDALNTAEDYVWIIPRDNAFAGAQVRHWDDMDTRSTFGTQPFNGVVEIVPEPSALALAVPLGLFGLRRRR